MIYVIIYLMLVTGSITMIYPFMIMLSSSVSSEVDYERYNAAPYYLWDDDLLWRKYLGLKYDREFTEFKHRYQITESVGDFRYYTGEFEPDRLTEGVAAGVKDWLDFKARQPLGSVDVFFTDKYRMGPTQLDYQNWLAKRHGNIQKFNLSLQPPGGYRYFNDVEFFVENMLGHNWPMLTKAEKDVWLEYKATLTPDSLRALSITHVYQKYLQGRFTNVEGLNEALGTDFESIFDVDFSSSPPEDPKMVETWEEFVHLTYPLRYARVPGDFTEEFKAYILALPEYHGNPAVYNEVVAQSADDAAPRDYFSEITWPETIPSSDFDSRLWTRFVDTLPAGAVQYYHMHADYRQFLLEKHGNLDGVNKAHGTSYESIAQVLPPYHNADLLHFSENRGKYKRYFLTNNYTKVLTYIFTNGYALKNTIILVSLWVFGNLTVQPMAAYALSRFNLSYSNKILLFLIATMSFPHSVTMIPNFLLLKNLHLLNTYAALILPHLVHGMGIFLLKGYFDSLPRELYEAGMIDGASEFQMFTRITLPLSLPILAVIGLHSFTAAYGSFMWAFLICQKESMWTLMVFLYQFKQLAPPYTHMAALCVAGVPTLIVFIFAQRIIMRGIVIPTMK